MIFKLKLRSEGKSRHPPPPPLQTLRPEKYISSDLQDVCLSQDTPQRSARLSYSTVFGVKYIISVPPLDRNFFRHSIIFQLLSGSHSFTEKNICPPYLILEGTSLKKLHIRRGGGGQSDPFPPCLTPSIRLT